jgi:hypothetical protein
MAGDLFVGMDGLEKTTLVRGVYVNLGDLFVGMDGLGKTTLVRGVYVSPKLSQWRSQGGPAGAMAPQHMTKIFLLESYNFYLYLVKEYNKIIVIYTY